MLDELNLTSISREENGVLGGRISEDEVLQAVNALGEGKALNRLGFQKSFSRSVGSI